MVVKRTVSGYGDYVLCIGSILAHYQDDPMLLPHHFIIIDTHRNLL